MDDRTGWQLLAGKIRTIGFIVAMTPVLLVIGLLSILAVILTSPITLIGMLKDRRRRK
ncbi:MAG: hypothetical protein ACPL7J_05375 [Desulfomonilaceae bacterium]